MFRKSIIIKINILLHQIFRISLEVRTSLRRISFQVNGIPVPKSRPRVVTKGKRRFAFTPKKVKEWEDVVKNEAEKHFERPFTWPVIVSLNFYLPRPKSRRLETWVPTTPDLDNLEKSVLDGLNQVAYTDDRLVVAKSSFKKYVQEDNPRVEITVTSLTNQKSLTDY
jgi:Holliday junction resolvase RusA-like endonuclease